MIDRASRCGKLRVKEHLPTTTTYNTELVLGGNLSLTLESCALRVTPGSRVKDKSQHSRSSSVT